MYFLNKKNVSINALRSLDFFVEDSEICTLRMSEGASAPTPTITPLVASVYGVCRNAANYYEV